MTIAEARARVAEVGARGAVEEAIARAKADNKHAILEIIETRALARADSIDQKIKAGNDAGALAGVPFLAKDNILTYGSKTTAGSRMLEDFEAPYQATVIDKLEAEGAICIGKTNLDSFAHGSSTENSYFGPTANFYDDTKVAGGSSGGSAVAVASGIVPFALGTDTGGSIRQPASFNGVFGLKPTYGSVSRYGVVAMASSTDVVGPIATSAEDVRTVYGVMKGIDERDSTTIDTDVVDLSNKQLRIGVIEQCFGDGVDDSVSSITLEAIDKLKQKGHIVQKVSLPTFRYALAVYYIVVSAELTSNLARYDGIKYGINVDAQSLNGVYEASRSEGFMDENKRRILIGNYVLSSGYYDAYYKKAQTVRTLIVNEFKEAFKQYDVLLSPTTPTPAFGLGENTKDLIKMYMADIMTVPASLVGASAISVPSGKMIEGLPVGLQFIAPMRQDDMVINIAKIWESIC